MYITKSDSSGTFIWARASQSTAGKPIGIVSDADGNVYLYGTYGISCHFISQTISSPSMNTYFLARFDSAGNIRWLKNVVPVDSIPRKTSTSGIAIDKSGNVYVTGSFPNPSITIGTSTLMNTDGSGASFDIFAAKYDSFGNVIWAKAFGGSSSEQGMGISVANSGDAYLAGYYYSPSVTFGGSTLVNSVGTLDTPYVFLARLDTGGAPIWATSAKGNKSDNIGGLACDKDDNVYMAGGYNNSQITFGATTLTGGGGGDAFLIKYALSGSLVYANSIGDSSADYGYSVAIDSCENAWVCGKMGATGIGAYSINIGSHTLNTPAGSNDAFFLVEYDNAGNYLSSVATQSGGNLQNNATTIDNQGNLYLAEVYMVNPFTLGSTTLTHPDNMFLAKYGYAPGPCSGGFLETTGQPAAFMATHVFPNPTTNEITVNSTNIIKKVEVLNLLGQVLLEREGNAKELKLNIAGLPAGIYLAKVNGSETRRFVKK